MKRIDEKERIRLTTVHSKLLNKKVVYNRAILPLFVLVTCLFLTYLLWNIAVTDRENELRTYLEYRSRDVYNRIEQRILNYEQVLRNVRGLFDALDNVSRREFSTFFNSIDINKNYPGIQGVGFSLLIPNKQIKEHTAGIRNEGFPEYKLWPEGNPETHTSIIYIEPFKDRNLRAFGYDMFSEPVRRKAMQTARDSNKTTISGKVNLVQEMGNEVQAGFLIYLPVYKKGTSNFIISERRKNIIGWVYSPFRMGDFMEGLFGEQGEDLHVEIYDGNSITNETKMYDSQHLVNNLNKTLEINKEIYFNGNEWIVLIKYTPQLELRIGHNTANIIRIVGISLSILFTIITWLIVNKKIFSLKVEAEHRLAESSLKRLQEEQQILLDNIPAWVFYKDTENRFIRVNKTFANVMGIPIDQLEGKSLFDIFPKEQAEAYLKDDKEVFALGKPKGNIIEQMKSPKGDIWVQTDKVPYIDVQGEIVGLIGFALDITDQIRMEKALKESESSFRLLFENAVFGFYRTDPEGNIILANKMLVKMLGYPSFEKLAKRNLEKEGFNPSFKRKKFLENIEKNGEVTNFESAWIRLDGTSIFVRENTRAIRDSKGKTLYYDGIVEDITERKKIDEELKESEEKFRIITEHSADAIFIVDYQGKYVYVNSKALQMLGYSKEEMLSFTIVDISPKNKVNEYLELLKQLLKDGSSFTEFELVKKNGNIIPTDFNAIVLPNGFIYASCRDISERKLVEEKIKKSYEQLTKLNATKDKFFSIIAHDLRSPFNGFINLTELMADSTEKLSLDEFIEYSKSLNKTAKNLYKLLENLLQWAQVQDGSINFSPQYSDLSKIVSQSIDTIYQRALQKRITIINEIDNSQKVFADEKMIEAVLRNLISNAVKFTRIDGKIFLKSKRLDNGTIEVSVADNGVGISAIDVKRIFKVEEKVSTLGTEGETSTGLGLLLCKEFIDLHGGNIWAESKENIGSTFYFTLRGKNGNETK